jgi:uncharacterized protein (TIGR02118 family)
MTNKPVLNIVATDCPAAKEAAFNKWYNEVHIPLLMKYKGITRVTRYKLMGETPGQARYLACYEFEDEAALAGHQASPEFAAAIAEMQESWPEGSFEIKWMASYLPLKTWER